MQKWTTSTLHSVVEQFETFSSVQQEETLSYLNTHYPPETYETHRQMRRAALEQMEKTRRVLLNTIQEFPPFVSSASQTITKKSLHGFGIVFTAGGEGERLKLSLQKRGIAPSTLVNFTKATYGLPDFYRNYGTLHANCFMVASLCKQYGIDIPVVITTGPEGSTTANIIPDIVRQYNHFGLKNIKVLPQDERLFLSTNEKIVQIERDGVIRPVTHPDETGGPIMKLKKKGTISQNKSVLDWFTGLGCHSTLIVQATAIYHQSLLPLMAASIGTHDCLGVGILRSEFPENDPYGTYVTLSGNNGKRTVILEQDVRNDITLTVKDSSNRFYLPFNTGFYAFNNNLLQENNLPDFATPPKEIHPDLPRTPKIGYAAIDLIALARNPLILAINSNMFGVLKSADDLERLAVLGKQFNLDRLCADFSQ